MMNLLVRQAGRRFATLAIAEHNGQALSKNTLKLLSAAGKLKDETHLLVCGEHEQALIDNIKSVSGSNVTQVIRANTTHVLAEEVTNIARDLIGKGGYKNVIGLSSSIGKDVVPRVAGYYEAQPISDVVEVVDSKTYVRPTYAGNALTRVTTEQEVNFLTFRPANFEEVAPESGNPEVVEVKPSQECRTSYVGDEKSDSSKPELTTARIVVSGGRGVKSKENFKIIEELADAFGEAAVGASRAAVDAGYCPNDMQVGQTGKVVAPQLYVAVGLSGAVQHLAGMKDSKVIVAINTKQDEPIFEVANYGLEGDLFKVLPQLSEKLKKIRAQ